MLGVIYAWEGGMSDWITENRVLFAVMTAVCCVPVAAAGDVEQVLVIGDRHLTVEGESLSDNVRLEVRWNQPGDAGGTPEDWETSSVVHFKNMQVSEGARLTLSLKNTGDGQDWHPRGYWCGAAWTPGKDTEGSWGVDAEMESGTLFVVGDALSPDTLGELALQASSWSESADYSPAMMVFQQSLTLTDRDCFAVGSTIEEGRRQGVNLLVGRYGALVVDQGHLNVTGALINAEEGARIHFETGSAIVLGDASETEEFRQAGEGWDGLLVNRSDVVTGLGNVVVVDAVNNEEGHLEENAEGGLTLQMGRWEAKGVLAGPVNEMHRLWQEGGRTGAMNDFFTSFPASRWAEEAVARNTILAKSLGSTQAMDEALWGGSRFVLQATSSKKETMPLEVELIRGHQKGRTVAWVDREGQWMRESEGLALTLRGEYGEWLWGARVLYEDADIEVGNNFIQSAAVDAESTVLTGTLYVGKRLEAMTLFADLSVSGAEDRVDFFQTGDLRIGSDEISRRAVSIGLGGHWAGAGRPAGWQPAMTASVRLTGYGKSDYDERLAGERLWSVEEERRLVGTLGMGTALERSWHRYTLVSDESGEGVHRRDDWVTLGLSAGGRLRCGDLKTVQRVTAGSGSAEMVTDDLGDWEVYAGLGVDGEWDGARMGVSAESLWGPDQRQSWQLRANVVWEI